MSDPERDDSTAALHTAVAAADHAAHGDSNDAEIHALRHALELALTRWPKPTPTPPPDAPRNTCADTPS